MAEKQVTDFQTEAGHIIEDLRTLLPAISEETVNKQLIGKIYLSWHEIKSLATLFECREIIELAFEFEKTFSKIHGKRLTITDRLKTMALESLEWLRALTEAKVYQQPVDLEEFYHYIDELKEHVAGQQQEPLDDQNMASSKSAEKKKNRILVIDDEVINRTLLSETIKTCCSQAEVVCVDNASEGLYLYFTDEFDLVFLDIMMPIIDGNNFLAIVEKNRKAKRIKKEANIVVQTAIQSLSQLTALTKKECVQEVLRKPIAASRIKECVERYCM